VSDEEEADILREDLRRMLRWSQDWQNNAVSSGKVLSYEHGKEKTIFII